MILAKRDRQPRYFSGSALHLSASAPDGCARETELLRRVTFPHRWTQTAEYVAAMRALWTKGEASFEGKYVKFPAIRSYPRPAQPSRAAGTARQPRQERPNASPSGATDGARFGSASTR